MIGRLINATGPVTRERRRKKEEQEERKKKRDHNNNKNNINKKRKKERKKKKKKAGCTAIRMRKSACSCATSLNHNERRDGTTTTRNK